MSDYDVSDGSEQQIIGNCLNVLNQGWYGKPHSLISLLQERYITKCEYLLLDFLLAFENRHVKDPRAAWFWVSDRVIALSRILSSKSIVKARFGLIEKGLIEVKMGYMGHSTEYIILIDKATYFRGGELGKSTTDLE